MTISHDVFVHEMVRNVSKSARILAAKKRPISVTNIIDLYKAITGGDVPKGANEKKVTGLVTKYIPKYTSAWVKPLKDGIALGGQGAETKTYKLKYPFDSKKLWASLDAIEDEVETAMAEEDAEFA